MNKLKVGIPAALFALSSYGVISCANKVKEQPVQTSPKTEAVIKSAPSDTFEKKETQEKDTPWWGKVLIAGGLVVGYGGFIALVNRYVNKLKNDSGSADYFHNLCE